MQDKPIGIFDSGLGGLTAVKEIVKIMPNEDIVYFGDTRRAPYGDKSRETVTKYTNQILYFLKQHDIKFALAACGTISSIVKFSDLKVDVPISGVLNSACISALNKTENKRIGVIATCATIESNAYKNKLVSLMPGVTVYQQACPMFAPMIESGLALSNKSLILDYAKQYLSGFRNLEIDTLILGCTHYLIIKDVIQAVLGEKIKLIDSGKESAKFVFDKLGQKELLSKKKSRGVCKFFVTDDKYKFLKTANAFLEKDVSRNTNVVNIDSWS